MMTNALIPVIISGGSGTRLWPVSREANPKPFILLPDGESLLRKTFLRASGLPDITEIMTVTNREYYFRTKDEYADSAMQQSFILEPEGRNTAAAIGMAALSLRERYGDDVLVLILPADHLITQQAAFIEAVEAAKQAAVNNDIVTFGIWPTAPETGYGYIEIASIQVNQATHVVQFVEKPDIETAQRYLADGHHVWNSGMFCFKAGVFLKTLSTCEPLLFDKLSTCWSVSNAMHKTELSTLQLDKKTFAEIPAISVDYAVMEKADAISVVPCDIGWSDIGSWDAVSSLIEADEQGNRVDGQAMLQDATNNYIHSSHRLVAALGVSDLMIIDTDDAVLVAHRDRAQDVRHVVQRLKKDDHDTHKYHKTVHRPWGTFTVLEEGESFKIKRIVVKPGQRLSLQMHHHRSEHWIVVKGIANVVNGEKTMQVNTNESTYIPAGHQHRLENREMTDLVLIEVQSGHYLGEDDIVRFDDQYGRA